MTKDKTMAKVDTTANLHDEVLELLLEYKKENKSDLTFKLRPHDNSSNKRYLNDGRWFMGSRDSISTSFLEYDSILFGRYELDFHITKKELYLDYDFLLDEFDDQKLIKGFFKDLLLELDEVGHRGILSIETSQDNFKTKFMGLLEIIDKLLKYEEFNQEDGFYRRISQEEFNENLVYIQNKKLEIRAKKSYRRLFNQSFGKVFLSSFSIKNYYSIKETSIPSLPSEAPWVFLTGENGAGKSLVLQALAIGLYGNKEDNIIPKNTKTKIEVTYKSIEGKDYKNNTKQLKKFISLPSFAGFGPIRLDVQTEGSENKSAKRSTATYGLFGNYDALFKNIETELKFAFYENKKKYNALIDMLKKVIPSLEKVEFDKRNRSIHYFEKSKIEGVYQAVTFSELATGIKSIIAMVGDIYLRFSTLKQKNINTDQFFDPKDLYGIVIIDEFDLHLHPTWQKQLPTLFSSVFPNIQFIVSTHSAIPILGAPKGSVLLKVNRNTETGITVERLKHIEQQLENLTPNLILTSDIFGLQNIFPTTHQPNERIRTENTMSELEENDEMLQALQSYMNTDKEDELLKMLKEK